MQVKTAKWLIFIAAILGVILLFVGFIIGLVGRDYFEDRQTGKKYYYTINEDWDMSDSSTWYNYKLENGKKLKATEVPENWKAKHEFTFNVPLIVIGILLMVPGGIYIVCLIAHKLSREYEYTSNDWFN